MLGLVPRDTVFFDLFEKAAANLNEGASALLEFLTRFDNLEERAKRIKDIEHAGDRITHETVERLNKTFITPLDREDIHALISRLDDILDMIDTAVNRMVLYKVRESTEDARALARCLVHATGLIKEMVAMLRSPKSVELILRKGMEIHTQENEADRIEQHALAALFDNGRDAAYIIKWKDIYEELEAATDRCEDVANIIEGIILKNA